MSSPYPRGIQNKDEEQIYALKMAATWLARVDDSQTSANTSEIKNTLLEDRQKRKQEYIENHLETIAEDFVANHEEMIIDLFNTDSIDRRIEILDTFKDQINERFGEYTPNEMSYDELEQIIKQTVEYYKNESPIDYFNELETEPSPRH